MKKIKIGQIGIGHEHALGKINALRGMPDVYEIVGVVDDRSSPAARRTGHDLDSYEGLTILTEEELFATPGLQAVAVETPNADLVPTALRCAERGLHMHMDKPGGEELEPFKRLLRICEEKGLAFQMGYMLRDNPSLKLCQKAVRQGWLGDVFQIHADMNHDYGGEDYQRYLSNFKGGIMFNLGCHLIDAIVSMMGRPEKVTPFPKSTNGAVTNVNNNGLAVLEYPHATATIQSCDQTVDGVKRRRFTVRGTQGTFEARPLECCPLKAQLTLLEDNDEYEAGTHVVERPGMTDRYQGQLLELARIINGEMENPYSYAHELLTQEVVLAAGGYTEWREPKQN